MPGFIGKRLCPDLVFIKANYPKYRENAALFRNILSKYDEDLESVGLDESALDVTQYLKDNNLNTQEGKIFIGVKIRKEIFD